MNVLLKILLILSLLISLSASSKIYLIHGYGGLGIEMGKI